MAMWNPWRGCHRYSEGCKFCYIHKGDAKRGVDTNKIVRTDDFCKPIARKKNGEYKMKSGLVYLCFSADFLIEDADPWRGECWDMIRERRDCQFLFLTKRIERFPDCIPEDWGDGWDNVIVGCTVENQKRADQRLRIFSSLPIKHKNIICQPMISAIDLEPYLPGVELVVAGGESDRFARPMYYAGYCPCGSSVSGRMFPLNSVSAEPTLLRTAENIPFRRRICVPKREKPISIIIPGKQQPLPTGLLQFMRTAQRSPRVGNIQF